MYQCSNYMCVNTIQGCPEQPKYFIMKIDKELWLIIPNNQDFIGFLFRTYKYFEK